MKTVYLAGPISGLSYNEATSGWRQTITSFLPDNVMVLSSMRGKKHLENVENLAPANQYSETVMSSGRGIITRDRFDVMSCDVMIVNLLGAKRVSIGTMVEYGWADAFRKPIITIIEPEGNLHDHDFVHELTSFKVHDLVSAARVVRSIFDTD